MIQLKKHGELGKQMELLCLPPLTIDIVNQRVLLDEAVVPLTVSELGILLLLAKEPGRSFTPGEIYRRVWGAPDLDVVDTVRVHISRIRKKLETACPDRKFVETVWCKGYSFRQSADGGSKPT